MIVGCAGRRPVRFDSLGFCPGFRSLARGHGPSIELLPGAFLGPGESLQALPLEIESADTTAGYPAAAVLDC